MPLRRLDLTSATVPVSPSSSSLPLPSWACPPLRTAFTPAHLSPGQPPPEPRPRPALLNPSYPSGHSLLTLCPAERTYWTRQKRRFESQILVQLSAQGPSLGLLPTPWTRTTPGKTKGLPPANPCPRGKHPPGFQGLECLPWARHGAYSSATSARKGRSRLPASGPLPSQDAVCRTPSSCFEGGGSWGLPPTSARGRGQVISQRGRSLCN